MQRAPHPTACFTAAAEIAARVRYAGQSLERASGDVVAALLSHGGDGGLIALGREGGAGFAVQFERDV